MVGISFTPLCEGQQPNADAPGSFGSSELLRARVVQHAHGSEDLLVLGTYVFGFCVCVCVCLCVFVCVCVYVCVLKLVSVRVQTGVA